MKKPSRFSIHIQRVFLFLFVVEISSLLIILAEPIFPIFSKSRQFCSLLVAACFLVLLCLIIMQNRYNHKQLLTLFDLEQELLSYLPQTISSDNPYKQLRLILEQYKTTLQKGIAEELINRNLELDVWQHQINPHFLYNTLDTIRGQALEDDSIQSAEMIEILSQILRYSLNRSSSMCTIDQELSCIQNYFRIQQYRFEDRFRLKIDIDENDFLLHRYPLPRLTLQPLIENAISHGLSPKKGSGTIQLRFYRTEKRIIIETIDDGIGIEPDRLKALNDILDSFTYDQPLVRGEKYNFGLALQNINARIKLLYGVDYGVVVFSSLNIGTQVIISFPLDVRFETVSKMKIF